MSALVTSPPNGWTPKELTFSVGMLTEPSPDLDRILDRFLRAGLRADFMVDASFAGWAVRRTPRYTADPEAVRAMARQYGVVLTSTSVGAGHLAVAMSQSGATERFHGTTECQAMVSALLMVMAPRPG